MLYLNRIEITGLPGDSYVTDIPAVRQIYEKEELSFKKPVTFFCGENGSGKSTLLEAIAVAEGFNAEGGSRDHMFSTRETHSELSEYICCHNAPKRPKDGYFLRAESFYNVASYLEESGSMMLRYGGVSLHEHSHGEAFMTLVTERFDGHGLYILDEPEAALSPNRLMSLIVAIDELVKLDSQFIIATHSPILMSYPDAEIMQFSENGIKTVTYRETESYILTKKFINEPERMIHYLLDEA